MSLDGLVEGTRYDGDSGSEVSEVAGIGMTSVIMHMKTSGRLLNAKGIAECTMRYEEGKAGLGEAGPCCSALSQAGNHRCRSED